MNVRPDRAVLLAALAAGFLLPSVRAADGFPPQPPVAYLTPEESMAHFQLPEGYRLELVLSEPVIKEPVVAAFDGNGRLFVAEMRTYMQDIDGRNSHAPVSRVSMHWSSKGDGVFDRHSVFIDGLVLPRMLLPLDDRILTMETDSGDVWSYRDTDGDGVADQKELFYRGQARRSNLEHQSSGLIWSIDNWIYTTYNAERVRWTPGGVVREPTAPNGGQWGLGQDDLGKPWFVNAGGEVGPLNFQVPIVYGAFNTPGQFEPGFREVFPLVPIPDVQGGPVRFRPEEKTLNHFTATCGTEIFRGDQLPDELKGDLLFAEPVGRLIRRSKVEVRDGLTQLRNAHPRSEFIRSSDPNFRPVNMTTAPDGTLFIVDMYRGIIQEGNWVREGSYLRKVVQQYQLDKNFGRGRIWRLVHETSKPGPQPRMLSDDSAALVRHLAHPNGWWRDTAQKLLILRQDQTVVPALRSMSREHPDALARIHALWTLEGLNALDRGLVGQGLKDADARVRATAIRVAETLHKRGVAGIAEDILARARDEAPEVVIQSLVTANLLGLPESKPLIEEVAETTTSKGVAEIARLILNPGQETPAVQFTATETRLLNRGAAIYKELCFSCHGDDGRGTPMSGAPAGTKLAPSLGESQTVLGHRDAVINVMLHGLAGPVAGKTYEAQMVPMGANDDAWIAAIVSYIRNNFGNRASFVTEKDVSAARAVAGDRADPWTIEELNAVVPRVLTNRAAWKLTASHRPDAAGAAVDGKSQTRYDTGVSQAPGQWFQIELAEPTEVAGLRLDTVPSPRDYPRGYKIDLSMDGKNWGASVVEGKAERPLTEILFKPTRARFIRITQTGAVDGLYWSIHELHVFEQGPPLTLSRPAAPKPANLFE